MPLAAPITPGGLVAATTLFPSADEATDAQNPEGTLLDVQDIPELSDVKIAPSSSAATNLIPSTEEATLCQYKPGVAFDVHVAPASVEM
jgi:hypothetical protein